MSLWLYVGDQDFNITHNLGGMAKEAGIYLPLWRPEECGVHDSKQLASAIEPGIVHMVTNRSKYTEYDTGNGWGTYDQFIPWLTEVLDFCKNNEPLPIRSSR